MATGKVCPAVRAGNVCSQRGCSYVHAVHRCQVCQAPFASKEARRQHEQSPAHPTDATYRCTLCSVRSTSRVDYDNHVRGRRHTNKLQSSSAAYGAQTQARSVKMNTPPNHRPCDVCGTFVPDKIWASHIAGSRHRSNSSGHAMTASLRTTETEKGDIQLDCEHVDFGIVDGGSGTLSYSKPVRIVNGGSTMVVFTGAKLSSNTRGNVFHLVDATRSRQLNYSNNTTVTVKLSASKSDRGVFKNRLELYFEIPSQRRRFAITRPVSARVGSSADYETLKNIGPQKLCKRPRKYRITRYFAGIRPQALARIVWVKILEDYDIPPSLDSILSNADMELVEKLKAIRSAYSLGDLNVRSYSKHMQIRIWAEEESARRELSQYDMEDVKLAKKGDKYELFIPSLAEKRPSVIATAFSQKKSGSDDELPSEGFVHIVESKAVLLRFHKKFKWSSGQGYDVRFDLNRLCFRRMHQAVTRPAEAGGRITFPSPTQELIPISRALLNTVRPYDKKITNNEPQRRAVASILVMPPGSVPFIVYGPPGTGKTVTIVEAMRQIVARDRDARILACAPSNSAADIIVERLSEHLSVLGDKPLHRLIAPSRFPDTVSKNVLKFTRMNEYNIFECPPRAELEAIRIIVSTCCSGGTPYSIGFESGHFTHIFIDEAAQATEPEVMIPIKTMLGPRTNVILSGDVKQLGPIVRSAVAIKLGLGISYLERLMSTPLYDENVAKNKSMVKLTKNYRSHPAILSFPNAKFYKNELEACANREITHCISGRWDGLINKEYPLIFHGICGQDERNETSPSYFNIDEAIVVKDYVKSLLDDQTLRLRPEDIGVITPYRAQVKKIRTLMESFARDATVGSVEIFQGQERKVIIMSTVRSSPDMIKFDLRHTLGFVANPRRFNVAVTRAQALLIIIGDPYVLALDPIWKEFINYVYQGGGYTGVPIDWDATEPVDNSVRLDEARRARSISELEELIRRIHELDLADDDEFEDAGAFREEE